MKIQFIIPVFDIERLTQRVLAERHGWAMKKVAIITLTRNPNYGNVLQNYAMESVISSLGLMAETVKNLTGSTLFGSNKKDLKKIIKWLINYHNTRDNDRKAFVFRKFCEQNIKYSSLIYQNGHFIGETEKLKDYDFFITGSDQVWNPMFGFASDFEFLTFAPSEKRLSYAASFGISDFSQLSQQMRDSIIDKVNGLRAVSVREKSGKDFIDRHCNVASEVHLDPTLLLSSEQWDQFSKKPTTLISSPYILVYMLGKLSSGYKNAINKLAKDNEAKIINLMERKWYCINPAEFVWLIKNAQYICTDSFHATVFSILFHRKFYIFSRIDSHAKQETRLQSLCEITGISTEKVMVNPQKLDLSNYEIDWNSVEEKLGQERQKSIHYLEEILVSG